LPGAGGATTITCAALGRRAPALAGGSLLPEDSIMAEARIPCPHCKSVLKLAAPPPAGKMIRCPRCGEPFKPDAPAEPEAEIPEIAPAKEPPVETVRAAPGRPRRDWGDEDRPRGRPGDGGPREAKKSGGGMVLALVGGGLLLVTCCCGVGVVAVFAGLVPIKVTQGPTNVTPKSNAVPGITDKTNTGPGNTEKTTTGPGVTEKTGTDKPNTDGPVTDKPKTDKGGGKGREVMARSSTKPGKKLQLVALAPTGAWLTWSEVPFDTKFHLWNAQNNMSRADQDAGVGFTTGLAFASDGKTLLLGGTNGEIRVWDAETLKARTFTGHNRSVQTVAPLADNRFVSGSVDKTLKIWDLASGNVLKTVKVPDVVRTVSCSADGKWALLLTSGSNAPLLYDLEAGKESDKKLDKFNIWSAALSPDGKTVAMGGWGGEIILWDVATGKERKTMALHQNMVNQLCFSADGKTLASAGSQDSLARTWDAYTGEALAYFKGHSGGVASVSISSDGRVLATAGGDGTIKVWDVPR
jgi:hypothetical protein